MTIQAAVLIETLIELGAKLHGALVIFFQQDHAAAAIASKGISVYVGENESRRV